MQKAFQFEQKWPKIFWCLSRKIITPLQKKITKLHLMDNNGDGDDTVGQIASLLELLQERIARENRVVAVKRIFAACLILTFAALMWYFRWSLFCECKMFF